MNHQNKILNKYQNMSCHLFFLNLAHCTLFEKSYMLYSKNKYIKTYKINSRAMNMCAFLKIKKIN